MSQNLPDNNLVSKKVCIVKSHYANLYSVSNAMSAIGCEAKVTDNPDEILSADALICPGVGSFSQVKDSLDEHNLTPVIKEFINSTKPFLGICVGMQVLFETGYEGKQPTKGLGVFEGEVVLLPDDKVLRIPHIGWNTLYKTQVAKNNKLLGSDSISSEDVYFVHSFYCRAKNENDVLATVKVFEDFEVPAIVAKNNVYGMQFHPERSGNVGLNLLRSFLELVSVKSNDSHELQV